MNLRFPAYGAGEIVHFSTPHYRKIGISAAGSPNQAGMLLVSEMTVTIMSEELLHILPTDRVCCMQMETKEREVV